jgi:AraC-like DNA-binding protein
MQKGLGRGTGRATVITVIEPELWSLIDVAGDSSFARVHATSVSEAIQSVRSYGAQAILVSPSIMRRHSVSEISKLVRGSPGVVSIAVLASEHQHSEDALLTLGACGVRRIVNLCDREGWNRLRSLVEETGGETGTAILARILVALGENESVAHFFGELVRLAPRTPSVTALADRLGRHPSSFTSRFFRAGLPSPKMYLAMTRLAYAAAFLERPHVSVADTAARLGYSSPQSFGRHIRSTLGLTTGEYRREYPFDKALEHFVHRLVFPYLGALRAFAPLGSGMIDRPRQVVRAELSAK